MNKYFFLFQFQKSLTISYNGEDASLSRKFVSPSLTYSSVHASKKQVLRELHSLIDSTICHIMCKAWSMFATQSKVIKLSLLLERTIPKKKVSKCLFIHSAIFYMEYILNSDCRQLNNSGIQKASKIGTIQISLQYTI